MRVLPWLTRCALVLAVAAPGAAHESLYHYVEITLPRGKGSVEVAFSVHAAELASARALGADPAGTDLAWLQGRTEAEFAPLLAESRRFFAATFGLHLPDETIDLAAEVRFPADPALAAGAEAARPGFLVATLRLPTEAAGLELLHRPDSGKRLMVVVNRPGAFPEVRDLAPGDTTTLDFARFPASANFIPPLKP